LSGGGASQPLREKAKTTSSDLVGASKRPAKILKQSCILTVTAPEERAGLREVLVGEIYLQLEGAEYVRQKP